jgi:hypothetical protein
MASLQDFMTLTHIFYLAGIIVIMTLLVIAAQKLPGHTRRALALT